MHIKKGDKVIVLAGKDKGKSGSVVKALPQKGKVVVEGINKLKKHMRKRKQNEKGKVVEMEMPIDVSNVKKAK